jgi:ankyrin repeat protein
MDARSNPELKPAEPSLREEEPQAQLFDFCPISGDSIHQLKHPVFCRVDDTIYEKSELEKLIREYKAVSPINRKPITPEDIVELPLYVKKILSSIKAAEELSEKRNEEFIKQKEELAAEKIKNEQLKKELDAQKEKEALFSKIQKDNKSILPEKTPKELNDFSVLRQQNENVLAAIVVKETMINYIIQQKTAVYLEKKKELKTTYQKHFADYKKVTEGFRAEMLHLVKSVQPDVSQQSEYNPLDMMDKTRLEWKKQDAAHKIILSEDLKLEAALDESYSKEIKPFIERADLASVNVPQLRAELKKIREQENKLSIEWANQRQASMIDTLTLFGGIKTPDPKVAPVEKKQAPEPSAPPAPPSSVRPIEIEQKVPQRQFAPDEKQPELHKKLMTAIRNNEPNQAIFALLDQIRDIKQIKDNKTNETPLLIACDTLNEEVVKELLLRGADPNTATTELLTNYREDVRINKPIGTTPLLWLIRHKEDPKAVNIAKILLEHNADVNASDSDKETALHWATFLGATSLVSLLLAQPMIDPMRLNSHGRTPLQDGRSSSGSKMNSAIRDALTEAEKNYQGQRSSAAPAFTGFSPYFYAEQKAPQQLPASAEAQSELHKKLMTAIRTNKPNHEIFALLDQIKDVKQIKDDKTNETPLFIACGMLNEDLLKALLLRGASPNIALTQTIPFNYVIANSNHVYGIPDAVLSIGTTPLLLLARHRENPKAVNVAKILLEHKADVNAVDSNDETTLHWAAFYGAKSLVNLLLAQPTINPVRLNNKRRTPSQDMRYNNRALNSAIMSVLEEAERNYKGPKPYIPPASFRPC